MSRRLMVVGRPIMEPPQEVLTAMAMMRNIEQRLQEHRSCRKCGRALQPGSKEWQSGRHGRCPR